MPFDVYIPESMGDKSLVPFFKGWNWFDDPESPVVIHIERGTHVAPWAATLFGAYAIWLKEVRGKEVSLSYNNQSYIGRFLEKIGLPQLLGEDIPAVSFDEKKIFPLTRIRESKEIGGIVSSVMHLLELDDNEVADAVKYALVELLRNVVQHARSRIGGLVSAVYFPESEIVDVIVADIGCGLRSSLRDSYKEINTDQKAVRFALQPHVSGTFYSGAYQSMRDNAGLGLFFIKEIAARSMGGFFLGSGDELADIRGTEEGDLKKSYIHSTTGGWRGTFAVLQLKKHSIGEFDSLLAKCREIAAEVRKNRSSFIVDFVDQPLEIDGLTVIKIKDFEEDVEAAADIRERVILPTLMNDQLLVLDFSDIRAATQSFVHALMYRVFRDGKNLETCLSVSCADKATEEAIRAVAAYAAVEGSGPDSVPS